jgi:hypothetical protein
LSSPKRSSLGSLSDEFSGQIRNVDWYTNRLYDFRDLLDNKQIVFPCCSLILESNRHPDLLDESVSLKDVHGVPIFKPGREPDEKLYRNTDRSPNNEALNRLRCAFAESLAEMARKAGFSRA